MFKKDFHRVVYSNGFEKRSWNFCLQKSLFLLTSAAFTTDLVSPKISN